MLWKLPNLLDINHRLKVKISSLKLAPISAIIMGTDALIPIRQEIKTNGLSNSMLGCKFLPFREELVYEREGRDKERKCSSVGKVVQQRQKGCAFNPYIPKEEID